MQHARPDTTRAILHVDMDAFFASVEVLDNPELKGKPVIVGTPPEARGVVAAASYEVRKFGVHSAMSSYRALKLCPHAIIIRPRGDRYAEVSRQIMKILSSYTPMVEQISIDEAFLDVTGSLHLLGTVQDIGRAIKKRIQDELGLTASVGIAPNKFLAKLASDLQKPDGFCVIEQHNAAETLAPLPVGKLWGVGKVTERELAAVNVHKIKDLFTCPRDLLESRLGSYTDTLLELAQGIDDRPVESADGQKSIGAETTFPQDIADRTRLRKRACILVERVARELRESGLRTRTVNIRARFPDFTTITRALTLPSPTAATKTIRKAALQLLMERVPKSKPLRLLGVSVTNLVAPREGQLELFPDEAEEKAEALDHIVDEIQEKFGENALRSAGIMEERPRMTKEEIAECPIRRYEGPVHVVRTKEELDRAVRRLKKETILGFDTETRPAFKKGEHYPPSILQLGGEHDVYIFQLKHVGLPKSLLAILTDPKIIKAGVSIDYDLLELAKLTPFEPAGFVDLEKLSKQAGLNNHGLRGMVAVLLGFRIPKSTKTSNWSNDPLTRAQITYAATDAWVGRKLYKKLSSRP